MEGSERKSIKSGTEKDGGGVPPRNTRIGAGAGDSRSSSNNNGISRFWKNYRRILKESFDAVPQSDYAGWFLQETDRVNNTSSGLMISSCKLTESGFRVYFEFWKDHDNPEKRLWVTLARVVAAIPENKVKCGNCKLSGIDWSHCLEFGQSHLDALFPQRT